MNVLVMSISRKIPMLKAVKEAMLRFNAQSILYGADSDNSCIGKYFVDVFWQCPPIDSLPLNHLIEYCKANRITIILPSRDGELIYFSNLRDELHAHGIHVMISNVNSVRLCIDKLSFYHKLSENNYPVIPTFTNMNFNSERYVVKERHGSGALHMGIGLNDEETQQHAVRLKSPIFQPYVSGLECSVDIYLNKQSIPHGAIVRQRIQVVEGESQITSSFHHEYIEKLCCDIAQFLQLKGHVLFQLLIDKNESIHIIECNCRFGGASTLSISMGLDSFYWFMMESTGKTLHHAPFLRSSADKTLIRHAEDFIL
ncbi:ATP-grasp domain-containing protein [Paenibacillus sp. MER TA 81-3]|uniref:ATP-grasp domain-containing protein n=1 Tax=Paenibacillus sp. MER TA 81-3 TaxID=2939573 RepID=UPI00204188E8|nr:ATP-grasp domain-containing protein [Paenibacillus sp. MER TA 81-3]MCM3338749.1 ATP-grasp domain-containing protein [Paenibacillus sp. MER TA 81-3]